MPDDGGSHVTPNRWHSAKLTAIGIGLVAATALVTGVMVANRPGYASGPRAESVANERAADATCLWLRSSLSSPCAAAQP
jgi:hypothetical protein